MENAKCYAPQILVGTEGLPREQWLEYRRKGIGGSDAAAVLGISPFRTGRDLYYDKLNIVTADDAENWVQLEVGTLLEPLVAKIFAHKTGYKIYRRPFMFQHPLYPWMLADLDYMAELPDGTTAILEIKTTNYNAKDNWWYNGEEIVPIYYESQGRHYMAVMNIDRVYFCCLYGNSEDEAMIRRIDRDMAYEEELIPMFQDKYPGVTVKGTYDSSGKLQTQIEEGLEADVFMSAAPKQMTALDGEGLIVSDTITNLLENKIVLIVPSDSDSGFTRFEDIEKAESIALGDPASVPVGQYSEEALTSLGIWDKIQDKVSFGTNVTEVLNQVAAASADAGIVYATDAASMADQVKVVAEAPEGSLAKKVIYPVAVVKDTANAEAAGNFVEFLKTDEAMKVFESYGFTKGE